MTGPTARCTICDATFPAPELGQRVDESELGRHILIEHPHALQMAMELLELLEEVEGNS